MNMHIKNLEHVSKEPVSVVREHPDRLVIGGVVYDGDYFRTIGCPDTDVLYAVRRDSEGVVCLTVIDSLEKAMEFFEETLTPTPLPEGEGIEEEGEDDVL
jgi:hypothetical protein